MATGVIKLQHIRDDKLGFARSLRREMTEAETILWNRVRRKQLGVKFRRQQIVEGFITDFFCEQAGLVIEIDGGIHTTAEQIAMDTLRRKVFEARGLAELRFTNKQVFNDINAVIETIKNRIDGHTTDLSPAPLPKREGND